MDKYKIKKNILDIKQTKPIFLGTDSLFWLFNQPPYFLKNKSADSFIFQNTSQN
jgi:hypothetical protein